MSAPSRSTPGGVLLGALAALLLCGSRAAAGAPPKQPIQYNHNVHAGKLAIDCTKCHAGTEKRERAGYPPEVFCQACHSSPQSDSQEEARLIALLESGVPLAWQQVTRLAPYVHFSHKRHVVVGKVDCVVCHGDMAARTVPIEEPFMKFERRPGMLRCIGCHRSSGSPYARIGCVDCHR